MAYENVEHGQQDAASSSSSDPNAGNDLGFDSTGADLNGVLNAQDGGFVSDEKKPLSKGSLVMAGILLACGVGTYVMYTRSAAVGGAPTPEAAAAHTTIDQFLQGDAGDVTKMKDMLQDTEKVVQQFLTSPGKKQIPIENLRTNPFRVAAVEEEAAPAVDENASKRQVEERRLAVLKSARALNLQFVMSGKRKSCMINNTVYREGQNVDGFKVETISADAVVVRKDDARFELRMKK